MVEVGVLEKLDADVGGLGVSSEFLIRHSVDEDDSVFHPKFFMVIDQIQPFFAVADHDESGAFDILERIEQFEEPPALLHAALVQYYLFLFQYFICLSERKFVDQIYIVQLTVVMYR